GRRRAPRHLGRADRRRTPGRSRRPAPPRPHHQPPPRPSRPPARRRRRWSVDAQEEPMNLRLHGLPAECERTLRLLAGTPGLLVASVRGPYPDRPPSVLIRLYLEVRLPEVPRGDPADQTDQTEATGQAGDREPDA